MVNKTEVDKTEEDKIHPIMFVEYLDVIRFKMPKPDTPNRFCIIHNRYDNALSLYSLEKDDSFICHRVQIIIKR